MKFLCQSRKARHRSSAAPCAALSKKSRDRAGSGRQRRCRAIPLSAWLRTPACRIERWQPARPPVIGRPVRSLIEEIPRSRRIWAPTPMSRHSFVRLASDSGLSNPAMATGTPAVPSRKKINTPRPFFLNAAKVLRMLSPPAMTSAIRCSLWDYRGHRRFCLGDRAVNGDRRQHYRAQGVARCTCLLRGQHLRAGSGMI